MRRCTCCWEPLLKKNSSLITIQALLTENKVCHTHHGEATHAFKMTKDRILDCDVTECIIYGVSSIEAFITKPPWDVTWGMPNSLHIFQLFFADYPKNTGPISSFFHWLLSVRRHRCQQHSRSSCSPPSGHNNAVPWQNSQPNKKINVVKRRSQENIDQKYKTTQVKSKPLCGGCRLPLIKSRLGVDLLKKHVWNTLAC